MRYHDTRKLIEFKVIQLNFVPTEEQRADILTKPLSGPKMETMKKIGLKSKEIRYHAGKLQQQETGGLSKALLFLLLMALLIPGINPFGFQKSRPLLWRKTSTPVSSDNGIQSSSPVIEIHKSLWLVDRRPSLSRYLEKRSGQMLKSLSPTLYHRKWEILSISTNNICSSHFKEICNNDPSHYHCYNSSWCLTWNRWSRNRGSGSESN